MATPHINAEPGEIADFVLMPGDPLRAKFIAEKYLTSARLVTDVRGILGFTGTFEGNPVSVMASGMGMPSMGIYSYELYTVYGVKSILRVGSAGSYVKSLNINDLMLVTSSYTDSSYAAVMSGTPASLCSPDADLNQSIQLAAKQLQIPLATGRVYSGDVFYITNPSFDYRDMVRTHNCLCTEMESFALFFNASQLHKKAACLLTISDSFVTGEKLTAEQRQTSFDSMIRAALNSL